MSGKFNIKSSKRETRPRSSDKIRKLKRDGSPDKPASPDQTRFRQEMGTPIPDPTIITNEEILGLQIKPEELEKLHSPLPPRGQQSGRHTSVMVRKMKPASEWDKPPTRMVKVARPAPPDAPLKDVDYTGFAGPRFDEEGKIIEHSILGSVEEFKREAQLQGGLPDSFTNISEKERTPRILSAKYEKQNSAKQVSRPAIEGSNALVNWQDRMYDRKRQQGHLSKLLDKPVGELVMNQADKFRQTQEMRYLIDRTIPAMDYGKGYRTGSEFWKQQEQIGSDLTGMHMSLTQTERGYPPPIQHVGIPREVLREKGTNVFDVRPPPSKPWHRSTYLKNRVDELEPVIRDLDPHIPDLLHIEMIGEPLRKEGKHRVSIQVTDNFGSEQKEYSDNKENIDTNDPLRDFPIVNPKPIFGPSIKFGGKPARWIGDSHSREGDIGCEARITLEAFTGARATNHLEVVNDGTTAIYYDWKKQPRTNPFDLIRANIQRFYFNNSSGVILPGDTVKFPFVFKSPGYGVFTELWHLQTHPAVCGGAALVVMLRGTALQEDKNAKRRSEIECDLARKQAEQVVKEVIDEMLNGVRTPPRPSSPVDAYITEEEVFTRRNPSLHYHLSVLDDMRALYAECFPPEEQQSIEWNFDVNIVKQMIMMTEFDEEEKRDELLTRFNKALSTLAFPTFSPVQKQMYTAAYKLMCETSEQLVTNAINIRQVLGIPEKSEIIPDDTKMESQHTAVENKRSRKGQSDPKEKKAAKEVKNAVKTLGKEQSKSSSKVPTAPKRPESNTSGLMAADRNPSPLSSDAELLVEAKFRQKFYAQAHLIISEMLDEMAALFSEIKDNDMCESLAL